MKLDDIALAIRRHLARFAADPTIAQRTWTNPKGEQRILTRYWGTHCWRAGSRVNVKYISYQGETSLTKDEAERYLAWLDAGNIGRHYDAARAPAETVDV